jgi:hypothetical protein
MKKEATPKHKGSNQRPLTKNKGNLKNQKIVNVGSPKQASLNQRLKARVTLFGFKSNVR